MISLKIMFAVPPYYKIASSVPGGIGIVATVAKNAGLDVSVLLALVGETLSDYNKRAATEIKDRGIDVLAMGGGSSHYPQIKQLFAIAKALGATTVLGGFIVDSSPEIVARNIGADYCVYGEGEYTFLELMQTLQENGDPGTVRGLVFMRDGELITTPPRECVQDLDTLPFIDGDLCHYDYSLSCDPVMPLNLSRSCHCNCTFCYRLSGSSYRVKSLDYSFKELDYHLAQPYGDKIKSLDILDDLLNDNKERLMEFCRRMKSYSIPFIAVTRVDCLDEESFIAFKDAGAFRVGMGVESASNRVLASMKKGYRIEQVKNAFELGRKYELPIHGQLIMGDIEEDMESVRESEELYEMYRHKNILNIQMIQVLPGTSLYKYAVEKNIITDELEFLEKGCPYVNISKLSNDEYEMLKDKYTTVNHNLFISRPLLPSVGLEVSIERNGRMIAPYNCPVCNSRIIATSSSARTSAAQICHQCGRWLHTNAATNIAPDPLDVYILQNLIDERFQKYAGTRVAIWGVTPIIRRFIQSSQTLRDMIVKAVDASFAKMAGETYCGLAVEDPSTLEDIEFDYILSQIYSHTSGRSEVYMIQNLTEAHFQKYARSRVVIWGITPLVKKFIESSQTLRDITVKVVDINYQKMASETYCGLPVEDPSALEGFEFDYILSGAYNRMAEISDSLKSMGIISPEFIDIAKKV